MPIQRGSYVRQIPPPLPVMLVTEFRVDQEAGKVQAIVEWGEADGTTHARALTLDNLQECEPSADELAGLDAWLAARDASALAINAEQVARDQADPYRDDPKAKEAAETKAADEVKPLPAA